MFRNTIWSINYGLEPLSWRRRITFAWSGSIELCPPSHPQMTSQHLSIHIVSISVNWLIWLQSIPKTVKDHHWSPIPIISFLLGKWPLTKPDQCGFQKVKAIHCCRKVSVPSSKLSCKQPTFSWVMQDGCRKEGRISSGSTEICSSLQNNSCFLVSWGDTVLDRLLSNIWPTATHHLWVKN